MYVRHFTLCPQRARPFPRHLQWVPLPRPVHGSQPKSARITAGKLPEVILPRSTMQWGQREVSHRPAPLAKWALIKLGRLRDRCVGA